MSDLDKALADLRAIGARFSPEARVGAEFANPSALYAPPSPEQQAAATADPNTGIQSQVVNPADPSLPPMPNPMQVQAAQTPGIGPSIPQPSVAPPPAGPPVQGLDTPKPILSPQMQGVMPSVESAIGLADAQPEDPYAPGAPGAPLPPAETEQDQEQRANNSVDAYTKAVADQGDAELAAQRDHATQKYEATNAYLRDLEKADGERQRDIAAMNAKNDMETAAWIQQMSDQASKEPNPHRYWENSSGLAKALWAVGIVAGAGHVALTPGAQNAALQMFNQEVDRDISLQEARLKREMAITELKGRMMEKRQDRNRTDLTDRYTMKYQRLSALERAAQAKADIPGDLDAAAKKAQSIALIQKAKMEVAQEKLGVMQKRTDAQVARDFQDKQRRLAESHDVRMAGINHANAVDLANINNKAALERTPVSLGESLGLSGSSRNPIDPKTGEPRYREIQSGPGTGLVFKDLKGGLANGDGRIMFRKEDGDAAREMEKTRISANERYTAVKDLLDELEHGQSGYRYAIHGTTDPKMEGLLNGLAQVTAKAQNGGKPTDKDFSIAMSQYVGFNPDGKWLDRAKFATHIPEVKKMLRDYLKGMPAKVNNELSAVPQDINGQGTPVWDPKYLTPQEPAPRTVGQIRGATPAALPGQYAAGRYEAQRKAHLEDSNVDGPADHDESVIDAILANAQDTDPETGNVVTAVRGPKSIELEVDRILKPVEERIAQLKGKIGDPKDPWNRGEPLTADEADELRRLNNTMTIARDVAGDAKKKAEETLADFKDYMVNMPVMAPGSARALARKRFGLRAPDEVDQITFDHNREAEKSSFRSGLGK